MEPNSDLIAHLIQALKPVHVDAEAIHWALRDAIDKKIPLTKESSDD